MRHLGPGFTGRRLLLGVLLELTQQIITPPDRVVESGFRIGFAGEDRFEILGDDVADLYEVAGFALRRCFRERQIAKLRK
jgi:hypothetical protein